MYGSLLDTLAIKMGFDYLSNLRRLDEYKKIQLRNLIKPIPASAFSEWEWKDALQYLTDKDVGPVVLVKTDRDMKVIWMILLLILLCVLGYEIYKAKKKD